MHTVKLRGGVRSELTVLTGYGGVRFLVFGRSCFPKSNAMYPDVTSGCIAPNFGNLFELRRKRSILKSVRTIFCLFTCLL